MDRDAGSWDRDYQDRGRHWSGAADIPTGLPQGARVLELGCGDGKTFSALAGRGFDVTGIDFSPHAAAMCRRFAGRQCDGNVLVADARHLPFRDGSFDAVTAVHVIGHMQAAHRAAIVRESFRVLAFGGTLQFCEFSLEDFRAGAGLLVEEQTRERKNGIITHYFSEEEVANLFAGFYRPVLFTRRWEMTVRGKRYPRAEISAEFIKR